jgi:lipopolysaccharide/colanic/teichoic acid biosynthesis glycosyltransferase
MILMAILIKMSSPGPIIFKQPRVGLRGRQFQLYKFRTMVLNADELKKELEELNEADGPAFKIADDPRVTKVGKFLRRTGLDELPQLFNVLKAKCP